MVPDCWGLTASDNKFGYSAHSPTNDQGVVSPTAALSSLPYTYEESMAALRFFYYKLGDRLFGQYGFVDAFDLNRLCNILKNEYLALGGNYEAIHHSEFLQQLINEGKVTMAEGGLFNGKTITYHDSCYLGRANEIYEAPRKVLEQLDAELVKMKSCKTRGLCCGAGGAQMFKEEEHGRTRINQERTEEALSTNATIVAAACPFCNTMITDGVKGKDKQASVKVFDIAELLAAGQGLENIVL